MGTASTRVLIHRRCRSRDLGDGRGSAAHRRIGRKPRRGSRRRRKAREAVAMRILNVRVGRELGNAEDMGLRAAEFLSCIEF